MTAATLRWWLLILVMAWPGIFPAQSPVHAATGRGSRADALARWYQGPVRYLLRGVEVDLFRSLETDTQRLTFIVQFWGRRDASPGTLENAAREEFWRRVARANSLFTRTTVPGWRTDMGRVYITLGPPHDREFDPFPQAEGGISMPISDFSGKTTAVTFGGNDPGEVSRGVERWSYRGLHAANLPTDLIIAFRKRADGEYELSTNPRDIDRFRDSMSSLVLEIDVLVGSEELEGKMHAQSNAQSKRMLSGSEDPGLETALDPAVGSAPSTIMSPRVQTVPVVGLTDAFNRLALALDMGRLGTVPRFEELMGELITSREFFGVLPFQVETHFYATTLESALATVTVSVPRQALGPQDLAPEGLEMALRVEGLDRPGYRQIYAAPGTFTLAPAQGSDPGHLVMQAVVQVPPGRYRFLVGLRTPGHGVVASGETVVEAPDFRRSGLALSTLCLARDLRSAEGLDPVTQDNAVAPFRVGSYHLVPRLNRRLGPEDHLVIYYQVYGADRQEGRPLLRAVYELSRLDQDGEQTVGDPIIFTDLRQAVQGWSVPVQGWPPGSYRLRVTVEDLLGGGAAGSETVFSVSEPVASAQPAAHPG